MQQQQQHQHTEIVGVKITLIFFDVISSKIRRFEIKKVTTKNFYLKLRKSQYIHF